MNWKGHLERDLVILRDCSCPTCGKYWGASYPMAIDHLMPPLRVKLTRSWHRLGIDGSQSLYYILLIVLTARSIDGGRDCRSHANYRVPAASQDLKQFPGECARGVRSDVV
jgi:hypothetical protein